jgi:hypothetical protein
LVAALVASSLPPPSSPPSRPPPSSPLIRPPPSSPHAGCRPLRPHAGRCPLCPHARRRPPPPSPPARRCSSLSHQLPQPAAALSRSRRRRPLPVAAASPADGTPSQTAGPATAHCMGAEEDQPPCPRRRLPPRTRPPLLCQGCFRGHHSSGATRKLADRRKMAGQKARLLPCRIWAGRPLACFTPSRGSGHGLSEAARGGETRCPRVEGGRRVPSPNGRRMMAWMERIRSVSVDAGRDSIQVACYGRCTCKKRETGPAEALTPRMMAT